MKHVLAALLTGIFLLGTSSISSALDLDMNKITEQAEDAQKEANEKAQDVAEKSEEKQTGKKGDGMMGDIKAKGKEMIKEKVDGM